VANQTGVGGGGVTAKGKGSPSFQRLLLPRAGPEYDRAYRVLDPLLSLAPEDEESRRKTYERIDRELWCKGKKVKPPKGLQRWSLDLEPHLDRLLLLQKALLTGCPKRPAPEGIEETEEIGEAELRLTWDEMQALQEAFNTVPLMFGVCPLNVEEERQAMLTARGRQEATSCRCQVALGLRLPDVSGEAKKRKTKRQETKEEVGKRIRQQQQRQLAFTTVATLTAYTAFVLASEKLALGELERVTCDGCAAPFLTHNAGKVQCADCRAQ
jgi:hypothetical protein